MELFLHLIVCKQNLYLYETELAELDLFESTKLFEIELIIWIKIDLALNNLQRLICYVTQTTNQLTIN